ncbi:MAG: alpha/beta hydrolase [Methylococcales bacterium]
MDFSLKFLVIVIINLASASAVANQCVILLHGLGRTSASMSTLENVLENNKYFVANIDYPSRHKTIQVLAKQAVTEGVQQCQSNHSSVINVVTHSLGGIILRHYLIDNKIPGLNNVVMLGPPNQGSEVVDHLRNIPGYEQILGPAGMQLGTSAMDLPRKLGSVDFKLGVIAGTSSFSPILSQMLPDPDDGKVSVTSTRVDGMSDFIMLPVSHTFMMNNADVINQVMAFLATSAFTIAN